MDWNWVDAAIGIVIIIALLDGFARGFLLQVVELVTFVAAVAAGLMWYNELADYLMATTGMSALVAKPIAFLGLWLAVDIVLSIILRFVYRRLPTILRTSFWNRVTGLVPAFVKSVAYLGLTLTVILSLPFAAAIKTPIEQSASARVMVDRTNFLVHALERQLGGSIAQTFNFLTTTTGSGQPVTGLQPIPTDRLKVAEELENRMLIYVNRERVKAGLELLVRDDALRSVARAHSQDMWMRGFFGHVNPDGADPFDRISAAGIAFTAAGENLALAPSIEIAHFGLMRSPSHRDNILYAAFGRVGIGVISAGSEGLMVTQNFAD